MRTKSWRRCPKGAGQPEPTARACAGGNSAAEAARRYRQHQQYRGGASAAVHHGLEFMFEAQQVRSDRHGSVQATRAAPTRCLVCRTRSSPIRFLHRQTGRLAVLRRRYGAERAAQPAFTRFAMANKMLIDATHPEETRVVVLRGNRVEEFDFESAQRKQLRGNIYLAKVTRVEPSLQAAFVDYGGNRHGFLAFSEIHPDYYQIPVADRQALIDEEGRAQRAADDEDDRRSRRTSRPQPAFRARRDEEVVRGELAETPTGEAPARPKKSRGRRTRPDRRRGRDQGRRRPKATDDAGRPRAGSTNRSADRASARSPSASATRASELRTRVRAALLPAESRSRCRRRPPTPREAQPSG